MDSKKIDFENDILNCSLIEKTRIKRVTKTITEDILSKIIYLNFEILENIILEVEEVFLENLKINRNNKEYLSNLEPKYAFCFDNNKVNELMSDEKINSKHKNLIKLWFAYDLIEVKKYSIVFWFKKYVYSRIYEDIELYKVINKKKISKRDKTKGKNILDDLLQRYYIDWNKAYHLKNDLSKTEIENIIQLSLDNKNLHFLYRRLPTLADKTIQKYFYPYLFFNRNDDYLYYKNSIEVLVTSSKKPIKLILKWIKPELIKEIFTIKKVWKDEIYYFKVTTYFELKKILFSKKYSSIIHTRKTSILNIFKTSFSAQSFLLPWVDLHNKSKIWTSLLEFLYKINLNKIEIYLGNNKKRLLDFKNILDDEEKISEKLLNIIKEIQELFKDKNYFDKIKNKLNFIISNLKYDETEAKDSISELYFDTIKNINPNFIKIKKEDLKSENKK